MTSASALDGSTHATEFVETTSLTAAKALARFYAETHDLPCEDNTVQLSPIKERKDGAGNTLYAIKPRQRPDSPQKLSSFKSNEKLTGQRIQTSPRRQTSRKLSGLARNIRYARSDPNMRVSGVQVTSILPSADGFYRPATRSKSKEMLAQTDAKLNSALAPSIILSLSPDVENRPRAASIPAAMFLPSASERRNEPPLVGDVLGRLLGWTDTDELPLRSVESNATLTSNVSSVVGSVFSKSPPLSTSTFAFESSQDQIVGMQQLPTDLQEHLQFNDEHLDPSTPTLTLSSFQAMQDQIASARRSAIPKKPKKRSGADTTPTSENPTKARLQKLGQSSPFGDGVNLPPDALRRGLKRARVRLDGEPILPMPASPAETSVYGSPVSTRLFSPSDKQAAAKDARFKSKSIFDVFQALEKPRSQDIVQHAGYASTPDLNKGRPHSRLKSNSSHHTLASDTPQIHAQHITVTFGPGDDPRFAIWGDKRAPLEQSFATSPALSQTSSNRSNTSSPALGSTASKRWSLSQARRPSVVEAKDNALSPTPSSTSASQPRVLLAATVERWIAEVTCKIDPDQLTDFFLTYRNFLSPLSLCQLLITRFDWALDPTTDPEDEASRRIVRVRTFVVIRHWLLNYFVEDFVPDTDLRSLFTNWLNATARDPRVKSSPSDSRLIKGLKKAVRRLKDTYSTLGSLEAQGTAQLSSSLYPGHTTSDSEAPKSRLAKQTSSSSLQNRSQVSTDVERDVDLRLPTFARISPTNSPRKHISDKGTAGFLLPVSPPRTRKSHNASDSHLSDTPPRPSMSPSLRGTPPLPLSDGPVSKAVSSTLGSFSRFKRMINNRTASGQYSAGDHLDAMLQDETMHSGVHFSPDQRLSDTSDPFVSSLRHSSATSPTSSSGLETPSDAELLGNYSAGSEGLGIVGLGPPVALHNGTRPELHHSVSSRTIKEKASVLQPGQFASVFQSHSHQRASVIQLDDVGLSDDSDSDGDFDEGVQPRIIRRLPAARNLRQANALRMLAPIRTASTASFGTTRAPSGFFARRLSSASATSNQSVSSAEEGGLRVISNFVVEGLDSDEEEPGDVEAALRRLEGHIDLDKQHEKAKRVETQMAKSRALGRTGPLSTDAESDVDSSHGQANSIDTDNRSSLSSRPRAASVLSAQLEQDSTPEQSGTNTPTPNIVALPEVVPKKLPTTPSSDRMSRLSSIKQSIARKPSIKHLFNRHARPPSTFTLGVPAALAGHRCFLLFSKTDHLAKQFCLIERDLLTNIGWQELVDGLWREHRVGVNVLDWHEYLKQRARQLVAARDTGEQLPSTEIQVAIARFNLVANWCASEIVKTVQIEERVALINKMIRLAWKCYRHCNFQTLTQIVHGLQSADVERLKRTWGRVGMWEMRVFRDLKAFTSHSHNFKSIRKMTDTIADQWGPPGLGTGAADMQTQRASTSTGKSRSSEMQGCIPFLGLVLRDLAMTHELPTFLDPSVPTESAQLGEDDGRLEQLADPAAFDELPALPPANSVLYPLINVHKARLIAGLVQRVLSFQEMASSLYPYDADPQLFRSCLALRCLPASEICQQSLRIEP